MNLPNKLTVVRVMMIPFFFILYFITSIPNHYLWAFVIFEVASITDLLDGQIARSRGLVTNFGKLMDPLADKLLVLAAVIVILAPGYGWGFLPEHVVLPVSWVSMFIILGRDLIVNAIRLVAAAAGTVIAADNFGKLKTIFQMTWLGLCLLEKSFRFDSLFAAFAAPEIFFTVLNIVGFILFGIMMFFTLLSGFNYVTKNRTMFADA